jgi:hypothetical protein
MEVSGSRNVRSGILSLDRRDGRACFERSDVPFQVSMMHVEADLAKRSVTITLNQKAYALTFSDKPIPPEPPIQTGKASSLGSGSASGVVVKSVFDALGRATGVNPPLQQRVLRVRIPPGNPIGPVPVPAPAPAPAPAPDGADPFR